MLVKLNKTNFAKLSICILILTNLLKSMSKKNILFREVTQNK